MKVIFVSGKYRGKTKAEVAKNVLEARKVAAKLWEGNDVSVFCPHTNTAFFDWDFPKINSIKYLDGGLEMLQRSDMVFMMKDWQASEGSRAEHALAQDLKKEIIYEVQQENT